MPDPDFSVSDVNLFVGRCLLFVIHEQFHCSVSLSIQIYTFHFGFGLCHQIELLRNACMVQRCNATMLGHGNSLHPRHLSQAASASWT